MEEYWNAVCIPLSRGYHTIIDAGDFELISQRKWHAAPNGRGTFYARSSIVVNGKRRTIHMHREILRIPEHLFGDHKSPDTLDNRRFNIRVATKAQNQQNQQKGTRIYKGVTKADDRWRARLQPRSGRIDLGCFNTPEEAAKAYDAAAIKHYGEFASLNFPKAVLDAANEQGAGIVYAD